MGETPRAEHEGLRKAAIVLAMLDTDTAVSVCSQLDAETVRRLADEIAHLTTVSQAERDAVLSEFLESLEQQEIVDGREKARELLKNVFGQEIEPSTLEESDTITGMNALREMDPETLHRYLQNELPQTIAVVLSYLGPEKVASFLMLVDEDLRAQIIYRMATMAALAPGAFEGVAEGIAELTRSAVLQGSGFEAVTPEFIANAISNLPAETVKQLMESLSQRAPDVAAQVDELIFTFEDVLDLDDRSLQMVLRAVDERTLALALRGLNDQQRERILSNLSTRARGMVEEEENLLGRVRARDVEAARRQIASTARQLAEKGEISLTKEGEDEYL